MPLTTQPTRADQPSATGIGRAKSNDVDHPATNLDVDYPAEEHEKIKDYLIDVCGEVGNHVGTAGSLNARVDANETTITALQVGATAPSDVTKAAAAAGSSTHAARIDHKHDVSTASASSISARANAEGTATSLARSDHKHAVALTVQTFVADGTIATTTGVALIDSGSATRSITLPDPALVPAFLPIFLIHYAGTTTLIALLRHGTEKIDGTAATRNLVSVADHFARWWVWTDGTDWYTATMSPADTTTTPQAINANAGGAGGGARSSPIDHTHQVQVGSPTGLARSNVDGTSATLARADHQHDSGDGTFDDSLVTGTHSLPNADFIIVDTSGGNVTINLPANPILTGTCRSYSLKKRTTDTNKITLHPNGTDLIENINADLDLPGSTATTRPSWTLVWDTNNAAWWVF